MGQLNAFILEPLIEKYNLKVYFETGTGEAISLRHALKSNFEHFYTVDIDGEFIDNAKKIISNTNLTYIHNYSTKALEEYVPTLDKNKPVLFFLDAHFPGADFRGAKYDVAAPNAVPLEQELRLIKKYRPNGKDFIICDDARIYKMAQWHNGAIEWLQVPGGMDFIYELFPEERVSIDLREEGYILIDNR